MPIKPPFDQQIKRLMPTKRAHSAETDPVLLTCDYCLCSRTEPMYRGEEATPFFAIDFADGTGEYWVCASCLQTDKDIPEELR